MTSLINIKKSKIAGNGCFANQNISSNQTVCFLSGELCSIYEILRRVEEGKEDPSDPLEVGDEEYLDLDEMSRTFNHSCNPNAFIRGKNELVAIRDIQIGEEITYDYSITMNDAKEKIISVGRQLWTCKCCCGSTNCRGIIDQFHTLTKKTQNFYIKNKFMPDFMLIHFG
jgi:uncharacterized protein